MFVDFNILNQLGSPSINSNTFANRPPAGQIGRLFVSTDTFEIYRDNGTTWDLIGGPGSSTITGTGTANYITKFTGSQSIGNSIMTEGTGLITITGTDPRFVVGGTDDASSQLQTYSNVNTRWKFQVSSNNATDDADITGYRTRGTVAAPTAILAGDSITNYSGRGHNGTNFLGGGGMDIFAEENFTATAGGTYISFLTTSIGATTETEKIRLTANGFLGININTPAGLLHADGGASAARMILDADAGVARIFSFRSDNLPRWAFRVDGAETGSNAGADLAVRAYNDAGAFTFAPLTIARATGKANWQATEAYSTGLARGNYFDYNLSVAAGGSFSSPNSISAVGATLDLTLAGNATIPSGARSGLDAYNTVSFTGTGTLTHSQGTQIRAYSNLTTGWAFAGSATGTITHLAGMRVLFPDNSGSAVTVTNNYGLLINDQTANTGTVTYTNRWGIYQEGTSDLNYMAANLLLGSTTNTGNRLQVNGSSLFKTSGANTTFDSGAATDARIEFKRNGVRLSNLSWDTGLTGFNLDSGNNFFFLGGSLGIGTSNPLNLLHLFQSGANTIFRLGNNAAYDQFIYFNGNNDWSLGMDNSNSNAFVLSNSSSLGTNDRLVVTTAGLVGIGTSAPSSLLTTVGSSGINVTAGNGNQLYLNNTGQQYTQITFDHNSSGGTKGGIWWDNTNSFFEIYATLSAGLKFNTNATERVRITSGGNFLIGQTTDAGQKLQVNGSGSFAGTVETTGNFQLPASGVLTANSSGATIYLHAGATNPGGTIESVGGAAGSNAGTLIFRSGTGTGLQSERLRVKAEGQVRFNPLAADPAGAQAGDVYYNSGTNKLRLYDGTNWVDLN